VAPSSAWNSQSGLTAEAAHILSFWQGPLCNRLKKVKNNWNLFVLAFKNSQNGNTLDAF
jgi:hypothetical protein